MLLSLTLVVAAASADLSTEQLLELQQVRERVSRHVRIVCGGASCVRWDATHRVWRFARSGTLTDALPGNVWRDPSGNAWPYAFEDFVYLGMTADALRTAVTVLRCETPTAKAIETQLARKEVTSDLFTRWSSSGTLAKDWLVDAWGTPLRLHRLGPGSGQLRMGVTVLSETDMLHEWQVMSAGPDRKHGSADDIGGGNKLQVEGPARLTPYGYRPTRSGPHDQAIEEALLRRESESCLPHPGGGGR